MFNALIISDRECIKNLIKYFQPKILGRIDIAEDFDRGLNEIFNKRPTTVFIQSEISGVLAETVTKHIKGLLAADSPKVILLWESAMTKTPEQGDFDDTFDLSCPEEQLIPEFQKLLMTVPGVQWKTQILAQEKTPEVNQQPLHRSGKEVTSEAQTNSSELGGNIDFDIVDKVNDSILAEDAAENSYHVDLGNRDIPINALRPSSKGEPLFKILAFLVFLGLGIAIYYLFSQMVVNNTSTLSLAKIPVPLRPIQSQVSSALIPANHLFTFIPRQAIDSAYALKNPGWERYVSEEMEYLLFRENGALKAIQVIALKEKGIPKGFFHSVLREVSGGEDFIITSNSVSKGYNIQEGTATGSTSVAVYTKRKTGVTVAFVVLFS